MSSQKWGQIRLLNSDSTLSPDHPPNHIHPSYTRTQPSHPWRNHCIQAHITCTSCCFTTYSPHSPMLTGDTHHRAPASTCSTCEHMSLDTGMFLKSDYRKKKLCAKKELRVQLLKSRSPRQHSDPEPRSSGINLEGCPHSTQSVSPAQCLSHCSPRKQPCLVLGFLVPT